MKEVERIIRVDHAGEFGAINIYRSQMLIANLLYKDIKPKLAEMLEHEKEHFQRFDLWLQNNEVRHCYALWFWAFGGFVLGIITALLGRKSIWVCTNAIESTVLHHLDEQLNYLKLNSTTAYEAVLSIKSDEEEHQRYGQLHGSNSFIYLPIHWVVKYSTKFAIWLSTKL
ncbi:demethoxyubiquinone hydroxylase family protein [Thalassomonas actiniarum]|uniref:Demethoxyubiquinone hydroxylase family protein n=1 Tax=Thalassomonas actiniarum TaxID=485447 RepID=A0AAF0C1Z0_9GAMM|nr:demethoxyubiquinone hydroxylase family protein [Thalassomonas actiniarum]WDD97448.1 demethoxyubiquinone hydroxylase family protein [Thalassomonas actiniarum]